MIKNMLEKKVKQKVGASKLSATESFFVFVGNKIPDGCTFSVIHRINNVTNLRQVQRLGWIPLPHLSGYGGQRRIHVISLRITFILFISINFT